MPILHSADFTRIYNIKDYLLKYKHWVYCPVNGSDKFVRDPKDPEVLKRIYKNKNGYLEFMRRSAETDQDGLRPRIEIVPRILLPKETPIHVRYEVSLMEGGNEFRGMIFQFMDHTKDNKTHASFQFEMRDGNLHTRWLDSKGSQHIHKIATPTFKAPFAWYILDVYGILSPHTTKGLFKVYIDGNNVWDYHGITATDSDEGVQIQYGIYAVAGVKCRTQVRKLLWETIESIP